MSEKNNPSNPMKNIKLAKITLNIGGGTETENVEKAVSLLNKISGRKTVKTISMKRIPTWKVRPGLPVGARVTIRGKAARELLKRLLVAVENAIPETSFTENGFSFGVKEYIDIPDVKYDPKIGVIGLDVIVSLERPGYAVKKRKVRPAKISRKHIITAREACDWAVKEFGIKFREEER